ncbi:MAG TPA: hypothetical protein VG014_02140 [Acidimicrobiales bacterium]|nr:hypothetical protein [Acidimicrobiales bacterium]
MATAGLAVPLAIGGNPATAANSPGILCSSNGANPGSVPAGTYFGLVVVSGACAINAGAVVVTGNVTVSPGATLLAAYANNSTGPGPSSLTVAGNIIAGPGSTVLLGCEAAHFACIDDPNQANPTLAAAETVGGISASAALGILVHNTTISGDVIQSGGGGGVNCTPSGAFAQFMSPVYSDYEDDTIGGNISVTGLGSCWMGILRVQVGGSLTMSNNVMADPDANEVLTNGVAGNVICQGNSPANQYGDSAGLPNKVTGFAVGQCSFATLAPNPAPEPASPGPPPTPAIPAGPLTPISVPSGTLTGYTMGAADGGVFALGAAGFFGSGAGTSPSSPVVGIATAPGGRGYYLASANGKVLGEGPNAPSFGDVSALPLSKPIVGIAAAPGGDGYDLAASDGGVFTFNTKFYGSAGSLHLNQPIVGMAMAATGDGYWLVASDGGIFNYGPGASFQGSTGAIHLNQPIVGMAVDPATGGYWLVAADGGVFSFNAPFYGSTGGLHLNQPIVGMIAVPGGGGYWLVARDGGVFAIGPAAGFQGSTGGLHLNQPIVGIGLG